MRYSKYAALVCLIFSSLGSLAQIYTVTSKEDAGNGTLREALTNIPAGSASYTINFNLPGAAEDVNRTIRLRTKLPSIPSNVIIDGSSQPGWDKLGVSGAKIIIEPELTTSDFHGLTIGDFNAVYSQVVNVEIYGLYLRNFARFTSLQNVNTNQGSGIVIDYRASNIKIGAPGKGNVIGGTINGILVRNSGFYSTPALANISIQSNLIGVLYDGLTAVPNITGISANLYEANMTIGGDNAGEGNVIAANQTNINIGRTNGSATRTNVTIVNNKIGVDFSGTKDYHDLQLFLLSSTLEISGVKVNSTNTDLYLRNNIISGNRTVGVSIVNADFVLTSNLIGTGTAKTEDFGNGVGVRVEGTATGSIGGTVTADLGNVIAYNNFGVELLSTRPVKIIRNSFYCNRRFGIGPALNYTQAYAQVLIIRPNHLEGKATPNSDVELFYTQNCNGICEGRTYIITVQADNNGRWQYDGPPLTGNVTVTATPPLNVTTSQFSTAALLDNEAIITDVTCNGNGSIKIPEPREGFTFTWNRIEENGSKTELIPPGTTQEISGLTVGQYELIIDDGCKKISKLFIIKDQKLANLVVNWPVPTCGQNSFAFSGNVDRGVGAIIYQWINVVTGAITSGKNAVLAEGTYKLRVTDQVGCTLESATRIITRLPAPIINTGSRLVYPAACGIENGGIRNVVVTEVTGTPSYKWFSYNQTTGVTGALPVGTNLDLEDVAGGYYVLEVSDQSSCSPRRTGPIQIPIINSVFFMGGIITRTTCNTNNGAIKEIRITYANFYEWRSNSGQVLESGAYSPGQVLELVDRAPGTYTLMAKNTTTGCSNSQSYQIDQIVPFEYIFTPQIAAATCGINNGSITLNYTSAMPVNFAWKDASGVQLTGTNRELKNLAPGTYSFFTYDVNGCETVFGSYTIENTPLLTIEPLSGVVVNDGCSLLRGSISGVRVNGGIPPYNFTWENEAGQLIQSTKDLTGIPEGRYRMILKDNTSCGLAISDYYTVTNPSFVISTPVVNDLRVCYATEIMISVLAPEEGTYQLYMTENDPAPFIESTNGRFIFKVSKTGDYVVRRKLGSCYSEFNPLHIEVTNDNLEIKNTMTPNGDGMNDYWMITGLPDHADVNIKIYTRSGQLVYESVGAYSKPFDGRFRGSDLPAGAYYYKVDLRADCKPIGGSITLLR